MFDYITYIAILWFLVLYITTVGFNLVEHLLASHMAAMVTISVNTSHIVSL